jgi:hypothetical protein
MRRLISVLHLVPIHGQDAPCRGLVRWQEKGPGKGRRACDGNKFAVIMVVLEESFWLHALRGEA